MRVMLYHDKQANGATAAVLDILESADYQSFNNLVNSGRFRILMDRTYAMNYLTLASGGTLIWISSIFPLWENVFGNPVYFLVYLTSIGGLYYFNWF